MFYTESHNYRYIVMECAMARLGMQVANVKHSHCEAKFGFRVWETKFGRVRRKTSPAISDGLVGLC